METMHAIYRVTGVTKLGGFRLRVSFDDRSSREIDFEPVLKGEMYGPLREPGLFSQVAIDPEVKTLVWPNGADMDPDVLHGDRPAA